MIMFFEHRYGFDGTYKRSFGAKGLGNDEFVHPRYCTSEQPAKRSVDGFLFYFVLYMSEYLTNIMMI